MKIYRTSLASPRQRAVLGLHRSDYMLHGVEGDHRTVLQVELNTISSSFGGLSRQVNLEYFICGKSTAQLQIEYSDFRNAQGEFNTI
jgi:hypothetical protein